MARGAAQAQRKRAQAQPKAKPKRKQQTWEDQLFFARLRRHTKWMFVLLALVFAIGFVAFGVGSGSTGVGGIGDIFNSVFGQTSDILVAINAYKRYLKLEPNGVSASQARQTLAQLEPFLKKSQKH